MIEIKDKKMCCGCTACVNICPKQCIHMEYDEEGFLYPVVNKEKCINCGLCEKVCPILNKKEEKICNQKAYVINNKNDEIRKESTSGGAFTAIAKYIIKNGGVVYGATFNDNWEVVHKKAEREQDLKQFRGSKYVQSNLDHIFSEIKKQLDEDRWVCFSGTPCQIEGISNFLKKDYDKLVLVDVVCRAVPSPGFLKKYLKYIKENKLNGNEINQVLFRDKSKYGYRYSTMTIKTEKDTYRAGVETDPYLRAFFENYSDRPSCYECKFRKKCRNSDFTIWDCFNIEDFNKEMDDNKGTTRMLIHSDKGKKIFENLKEDFYYIEVSPEQLTKDVREMKYSVKPNINREDFFCDMNVMDTEEVIKKYFPDTIKVKIERKARKILVRTSVYKKIKKLVKKVIRRQ